VIQLGQFDWICCWTRWCWAVGRCYFEPQLVPDWTPDPCGCYPSQLFGTPDTVAVTSCTVDLRFTLTVVLLRLLLIPVIYSGLVGPVVVAPRWLDLDVWLPHSCWFYTHTHTHSIYLPHIPIAVTFRFFTFCCTFTFVWTIYHTHTLPHWFTVVRLSPTLQLILVVRTVYICYIDLVVPHTFPDVGHIPTVIWFCCWFGLVWCGLPWLHIWLVDLTRFTHTHTHLLLIYPLHFCTVQLLVDLGRTHPTVGTHHIWDYDCYGCYYTRTRSTFPGYTHLVRFYLGWFGHYSYGLHSRLVYPAVTHTRFGFTHIYLRSDLRHTRFLFATVYGWTFYIHTRLGYTHTFTIYLRLDRLLRLPGYGGLRIYSYIYVYTFVPHWTHIHSYITIWTWLVYVPGYTFTVGFTLPPPPPPPRTFTGWTFTRYIWFGLRLRLHHTFTLVHVYGRFTFTIYVFTLCLRDTFGRLDTRLLLVAFTLVWFIRLLDLWTLTVFTFYIWFSAYGRTVTLGHSLHTHVYTVCYPRLHIYPLNYGSCGLHVATRTVPVIYTCGWLFGTGYGCTFLLLTFGWVDVIGWTLVDYLRWLLLVTVTVWLVTRLLVTHVFTTLLHTTILRSPHTRLRYVYITWPHGHVAGWLPYTLCCGLDSFTVWTHGWLHDWTQLGRLRYRTVVGRCRLGCLRFYGSHTYVLRFPFPTHIHTHTRLHGSPLHTRLVGWLDVGIRWLLVYITRLHGYLCLVVTLLLRFYGYTHFAVTLHHTVYGPLQLVRFTLLYLRLHVVTLVTVPICYGCCPVTFTIAFGWAQLHYGPHIVVGLLYVGRLRTVTRLLWTHLTVGYGCCCCWFVDLVIYSWTHYTVILFTIHIYIYGWLLGRDSPFGRSRLLPLPDVDLGLHLLVIYCWLRLHIYTRLLVGSGYTFGYV